jgi:hypothetical protein
VTAPGITRPPTGFHATTGPQQRLSRRYVLLVRSHPGKTATRAAMRSARPLVCYSSVVCHSQPHTSTLAACMSQGTLKAEAPVMHGPPCVTPCHSPVAAPHRSRAQETRRMWGATGTTRAAHRPDPPRACGPPRRSPARAPPPRDPGAIVARSGPPPVTRLASVFLGACICMFTARRISVPVHRGRGADSAMPCPPEP